MHLLSNMIFKILKRNFIKNWLHKDASNLKKIVFTTLSCKNFQVCLFVFFCYRIQTFFLLVTFKHWPRIHSIYPMLASQDFIFTTLCFIVTTSQYTILLSFKSAILCFVFCTQGAIKFLRKTTGWRPSVFTELYNNYSSVGRKQRRGKFQHFISSFYRTIICKINYIPFPPLNVLKS